MNYQFKIQIKRITKPPVWRRILVSDDMTFADLHEIIQCVFGWGNYHLYQFKDKEFGSEIRITEPLILMICMILKLWIPANFF